VGGRERGDGGENNKNAHLDGLVVHGARGGNLRVTARALSTAHVVALPGPYLGPSLGPYSTHPGLSLISLSNWAPITHYRTHHNAVARVVGRHVAVQVRLGQGRQRGVRATHRLATTTHTEGLGVENGLGCERGGRCRWALNRGRSMLRTMDTEGGTCVTVRTWPSPVPM